MRYLSEGNYEEAIIAFTAAIEIDPMNEEAYYQLVQIHVEKKDYAAAKRVLEEALERIESDRLTVMLEDIQNLQSESFTLTIKNETPEWGVLRAYRMIETDGWQMKNGVEIQSGGFVPYKDNYIALEIVDIADGYRVKSVLWNGEDRAGDLIYGGSLGGAFHIEEDTELVLTMEKIPDDLPAIPNAIIEESWDGNEHALVAVLAETDVPEDKIDYIWEYREPDQNEWVAIWFWKGYRWCLVKPFRGQEVDLTGKYVRLTVQGKEGFSTGSYTTEEFYVSE